ncbi:MAG: putative pre6S rRNA nuclease [Patescibacteria group bacterium]|nr:putative pre6S rRNA nuclease [Patescibacteria group bacterium]
MSNKVLNLNSEIRATRYLGIDYGKSRVGLAVADGETGMAFVYGTLDNDKDFLNNLLEIINKEKITQVVIGIPSYINRKEVQYDGEKLGKMIKEALPRVEIEYQNEMFTTKMAQYNLIERGVKGVKKHDDEEAARIILQSWLDGKRVTRNT